MQATIESIFHVAPDVFWARLFFDPDYNAGLYRALSFESYEVLSLETKPDGRIVRKLRAEPPLSGPEIVRKALRGRIYYVEEGTYDPARSVWEFVNDSSVKAGETRVAGTIRALPHPQGMLHRVELDISVSALGLGSIIERQIEKSTRESYQVTTRYTNAFVAERGLGFAQPAELSR
ncbi:MAG TPA: DUF2505 family protein [Polyangiales bacterium]